MTTQHTPGPWNRGYGNFVYRGEFNPPIQGQLLATCYPTNGTSEELLTAFANAKLIAAAPDLLDALKTLLNMEVKGHALQDRLQFSTAGREILQKAQAAIAKATQP